MVMINTHVAKKKLSSILSGIETNGETVHICRDGRPIAELRPLLKNNDRLKVDAKLSKIKFFESAASRMTEEDWPEVSR